MAEQDTSNLPILDDIIKPGHSDKAAERAANRPAPSVWPEDHTTRALPPAVSAPSNTSDARSGAIEIQAGHQLDIEAITEAIMVSLQDELDQMLRQKIMHALKQHLSNNSESR